MPFITDAAVCGRISSRTVTYARASNFGVHAHVDGGRGGREWCVTIPEGKKREVGNGLEGSGVSLTVGLHPARRLRELTGGNLAEIAKRARRVFANLAAEWPAKIIRFFATRSLRRVREVEVK